MALRLLLTVAATALAILPAVAADSRSSLDGRWELDKEASDPVDPMLQWQGHSRFRRAIARRMNITLDVTVGENEMHEAFDSTLVSREQHLPLDDTWRDGEDAEGNPVERRARRENDAIVIETRIVLGDGTPALVRVTRTASGDRMQNRIELEAEDGRRFEALRHFRRAAAGD